MLPSPSTREGPREGSVARMPSCEDTGGDPGEGKMSADLAEIRKPEPQYPYAPDVLAMLLADKRSENTRRAYRYDLNTFFQVAYGSEPTPECMGRFLTLATPQMAAMILRFKAQQINEGRSEATVNRRLAAILSLVKFA